MKSRGVLGFLLIVVGIALLLGRFGYVEYYRLFELIRFWPVLLIAFGIGLLFPRNRWVLPGLLALVVVGAAVYLAVVPAQAGVETTNLTAGPAGAEGIEELETTIDFAAGELRVTGGAEYAADIEARHLRRMGPPRLSFDGSEDARAEVALSYPEQEGSWFDWPRMDRNGHNRLELRLNEGPAHDLEVGFAAGFGRIDLTELVVRKFNLNMAAGKAEVSFGLPEGRELATTVAAVELAAGELELEVPADAGVRLSLTKVAGSSNVDRLNWRRDGNDYYSPNYNEADYRLDIAVDLVAGTLKMKTR